MALSGIASKNQKIYELTMGQKKDDSKQASAQSIESRRTWYGTDDSRFIAIDRSTIFPIINI